MSQVNISNVVVLDNPSPFNNPFQFEITFECLEHLCDGKWYIPATLEFWSWWAFKSFRRKTVQSEKDNTWLYFIPTKLVGCVDHQLSRKKENNIEVFPPANTESQAV